MSITQRTIKLLLATTIAILVAQSFHLLYAPSAGIIALLSILDTRRSTLKIAKKRFVSMIIALFIGCVAYTLIGPSYFILPLVC
ncbi:MAG: aromatic acid exporter family protein, partial [Wohlfahrtiimonas sp.]